MTLSDLEYDVLDIGGGEFLTTPPTIQLDPSSIISQDQYNRVRVDTINGKAEVLGDEPEAEITRGCQQEGGGGNRLLAVDTLLDLSEGTRMMLIQRRLGNTVVDLVNRALSLVEGWCRKENLQGRP